MMNQRELINQWRAYQHRMMRKHPKVDWFSVPCPTCRGIAQAKIVNSQTETGHATEHPPRHPDRDDRRATDGAHRHGLLED